MSEWISVKGVSFNNIIVNETVLITDGWEVYPGFLDSMHEWRFNSQDSCDEVDFHVSHFMPLPEPPEE